jgi:light-regulated signal transduction histidine kinase (bacteriophytochrome)
LTASRPQRSRSRHRITRKDHIAAEQIEGELTSQYRRWRGIDPNVIAGLFNPASHRLEVSEISGRGVGLDVVKTTIEELGGSVTVNSEPDRLTLSNHAPAIRVNRGKSIFGCIVCHFVARSNASATATATPRRKHHR